MKDLFTLTDRLIEARPLTREKVEQLTGVRLGVNSGATNPFYALYVSAAPHGFLKRVELREALRGATRKGGLVILDVDPQAAGVKHAQVPERYGKDFRYEPPAPSGPPGGLAYYLYTRPWGDLRIGFELSHGWVEAVVIDAEN